MTENLLNGAEFDEDLVDGLDEDAEDFGEEEVVFASKCVAQERESAHNHA